jgi:hypothetical protein
MALNGSVFYPTRRTFTVQNFLQRLDLLDLFPRMLSFYHDAKSVLTLYCKTLILWLLPKDEVQQLSPLLCRTANATCGCLRGLFFK